MKDRTEETGSLAKWFQDHQSLFNISEVEKQAGIGVSVLNRWLKEERPLSDINRQKLEEFLNTLAFATNERN